MNANDWNALRKQPDKAKKMLSALHMSPAYLKVSWGTLSEDEQAKVSKWIVKNGSGWFEKGELTATPTGMRQVAPKHRKASIKKKSEGILRKPMKKEKSVRTVKRTAPKNKHTEKITSLKADGWELVASDLNQTDYTAQTKALIQQGYQTKGLADKEHKTYLLFRKGEVQTKTEQHTGKPYRKKTLSEMEYQYVLNLICNNCGHEFEDYEDCECPECGSPGVSEVESESEEKEEKTPKQETIDDQKPDDSTLEQVRKADIDMEGLYVDDTEGIRLKFLDGELKGKTAHRCPECDRGLNWSKSKSVFACGEHGSIQPKEAFDMRRIGHDKEANEWANRVYGNFLEEARRDGFKSVEEHYNSLSDTDNGGDKKWIALGVALEKLLPKSDIAKANKELDEGFFEMVSNRIDEAKEEFDKTGETAEYNLAWQTEFKKYYEAVPEGDRAELDSKLYWLSNYIHEKKQEKKKAEEDKKSPTQIYLEKELQHRRDANDDTPIPLLYDTKEGVQVAIDFARTTSPLPIEIVFDNLKIRVHYYHNEKRDPTRLEVTAFNEKNEQIYFTKDLDMDFTVEHLLTFKKGAERLQEEAKKSPVPFDVFDYYVSAHPKAMAHHLKQLGITASDRETQSSELNRKIVEDETNSLRTEIEDKPLAYLEKMIEKEEAESEKEEAKPEKESKQSGTTTYYKSVDDNGKMTRVQIKKPYPFIAEGIEFVAHKEGKMWHATEVSTGLKFIEGTTQLGTEESTKSLVKKYGVSGIQTKIAEAKQQLAERGLS